jgi:hypothetical protein
MWKAALLAALALALGTVSTARADGASVVGAYGCWAGGGQVTRPAGTEIEVRFGWAATTQGLVRNYLGAQTTALVVNGGAAQDVSGDYGPIAPYGTSYWASFVQEPTGVVLAPGESMTFVLAVTLSHLITDGISQAGPGTLGVFTCTVTGV